MIRRTSPPPHRPGDNEDNSNGCRTSPKLFGASHPLKKVGHFKRCRPLPSIRITPPQTSDAEQRYPAGTSAGAGIRDDNNNDKHRDRLQWQWRGVNQALGYADAKRSNQWDGGNG